MRPLLGAVTIVDNATCSDDNKVIQRHIFVSFITFPTTTTSNNSNNNDNNDNVADCWHKSSVGRSVGWFVVVLVVGLAWSSVSLPKTEMAILPMRKQRSENDVRPRTTFQEFEWSCRTVESCLADGIGILFGRGG